MNSEPDQLRADAFDCVHCAALGAFARSPVNARFYKFPPMIGAQRDVDLLFIGINPRRSKSNLRLHDWLVESPWAFATLANNRLSKGDPYIAISGEEEHYHCHMIVVEGVFGMGTLFETKAAATELMFCASTNEPALLSHMKSPCAGLYLSRVMKVAKPKVVIAVGSGVRRHLQQHFQDVVPVPVVRMEHPRQLKGKSLQEKTTVLRATIDEVHLKLRLVG